MKAIAIDTVTQAVIDHADGGKTHPRLYEIYTSLVKHLHAFVRAESNSPQTAILLKANE